MNGMLGHLPRAGVLFASLASIALMHGRPAALSPPGVSVADTTAGLPECAHKWGPYIKAKGDTVLADSVLSLPQGITDIPEFHDCQRFVVEVGGTARYDSLYAIFGAWDLGARFDSIRAHHDSIVVPAMTTADSAATLLASGAVIQPAGPGSGDGAVATSVTSARGFALVEIYAEGSYAPLHITPGFNCVYFYMSGSTPVAKMVNYGLGEHDCSMPVNFLAIPGSMLQVVRVVNALHPIAEGDYPVAARWDWDARHHIQYFGVKCGTAWCEVGPAHFTGSAALAAPPAAPPGGALPAWHRVFHIKGWFDEQQLARPLGPAMPRPSNIRGAVVPDPRLDGLRKIQFHSWQPVAYVAIEGADIGYGAKLNVLPPTGLATTSWRGLNKVEMCWGSWEACSPGVTQPANVASPCASPDEYDQEAPEDHALWWARITSSGGVQYRCVRRRDHSTLSAKYPRPRGSARWRWTSGDEIVWVSCDLGCCEVERMGP